ncbi:MAG: RecX family transcriptional regulator [Anaerolineales bacterium]|nr:RecX family transcriptional regulator [Anaerolineales bacterium]
MMEHRITALKVQKRNQQRVNVYLDGEFAFGLARITAAWLSVGQVLSEEKIAQLQAEDELEKYYQRALRLLNYRPRTETEISQYLQKKSASEDIIGIVLNRLKTSGLVDDERFAQTWVENRTELRPRSRRALVYELRQRGVSDEIIQDSIDQTDDGDLAYQAALRRARRITSLDWNEYRQKMLRYLAQRGFNYDVSNEAARRVWDEIHITEINQGEEA